MLDFRSDLMSLLPPEVWRQVELLECALVAAGCLWQLVYDPKFRVVATWGNRSARIGLIAQFIFALAGVGESFRNTSPQVILIGYITGTLLVQGALFWRWLGAGRPAFAE